MEILPPITKLEINLSYYLFYLFNIRDNVFLILIMTYNFTEHEDILKIIFRILQKSRFPHLCVVFGKKK